MFDNVLDDSNTNGWQDLQEVSISSYSHSIITCSIPRDTVSSSSLSHEKFSYRNIFLALKNSSRFLGDNTFLYDGMMYMCIHMQDSAGSQQLLLNAETYGQYVAKSLMSSSVDIGNQSDITLVHDNIRECLHVHIIGDSYHDDIIL